MIITDKNKAIFEYIFNWLDTDIDKVNYNDNKEKDIDAVTISTPDHVHAPAAVYAMERDKHVYVQKPITHNIREARMLTNLARKLRKIKQNTRTTA